MPPFRQPRGVSARLAPPADAGLAGRHPNFTLETPQQAAGNGSAFKSGRAVFLLCALATWRETFRDMPTRPIQFHDRYRQTLETEQIYGEWWLRFTYENPVGRLFLWLLV